MSIEKTSDTKWVLTSLSDYTDDNDYHDIEATKDGLKIDYDTIPWDEIDEARAFLTKMEARRS